jgi:hypothetical protein
MDISGQPSDPALQKELEDFLKQRLGPKAYQDYLKRQAQSPAPPR